MNMAELRYLQDYIGESLAFWTECRDQYTTPRFTACVAIVAYGGLGL